MSYYPSSRSEGLRAGLASGLLGKVFGLLAFSLAFAVLGGLVGAQLGPGWILPLVLVEIGLIIGVNVARDKDGLNLILLYAFTFVSGMTLGPIIDAYIGAGFGYIVAEAVAITAVMTVGLSAYALTTRRDFSGLAPYLFVGVLGLFVVMIVNLFVGGTFLSGLIGWVGAVIFSLLLIYDVQRAKRAEDTMGNAVVITVGVYLDVINIFLFVLRILSSLQGGRD
jgi:FtsH-binding integral membrane protein